MVSFVFLRLFFFDELFHKPHFFGRELLYFLDGFVLLLLVWESCFLMSVLLDPYFGGSFV